MRVLEEWIDAGHCSARRGRTRDKRDRHGQPRLDRGDTWRPSRHARDGYCVQVPEISRTDCTRTLGPAIELDEPWP
jgi:hypothetical protein